MKDKRSIKTICSAVMFFTVFCAFGFIGGMFIHFGFLVLMLFASTAFPIVLEVRTLWVTVVCVAGFLSGWVFGTMCFHGFDSERVILAAGAALCIFYLISNKVDEHDSFTKIKT